MQDPQSTTAASATPGAASGAATAAAPAPAPKVRKGRGNFSRQLRTDLLERQAKEHQAQEANTSSSTSVAASGTTGVQATIINHRQPGNAVNAAPEDEVAAPNADKKKAIPLDNPVYRIDDRTHYFGTRNELGGPETADTIKQVIFRGEKRRRYCVIVGDLQGVHRQVTLKLFGHKGWKPLQLQDKLIRLVNLSIGKPRVHHHEDPAEAAPEGQEAPAEGTDTHPQEGEAGDLQQRAAVSSEGDAHDAQGEELDAAATGRHDEGEEHQAEGGEREDPTVPPAMLVPPSRAPPAMDDFFSEPKKQHLEMAKRAAAAAAAAAAEEQEEYMLYDEADLAEFDDADLEERKARDEVVPLQVESSDGGASSGMMNENSLALNAVLTARYYDSLERYFTSEFTYLLGMEDVAAQHVTVQVSVGAAYCCLARRGSHSTQLKYATFGEFVERMNEESMQMYFLRDCPQSISRGVNQTATRFHNEAEIVQVRIYFFSNERQSRSVARAVWNSEENSFRLLDMENVGINFQWTIFSLDETYAMQRAREQHHYTPAELMADFNNKKTVAYPFEIEFRSFKRWKQHEDHPAAPLAEAILERLSTAEQNRQNHGSSIGYEKMDLSYVCEIDYASEDINVERIVVEHIQRGRVIDTMLTLDNTTSLHIENFAAARQLLSRLNDLGPAKVAQMQNASNNNYVRGRGRHGGRRRGYDTDMKELNINLEEMLRPASKLTFFRSRGSMLHWRISPSGSVADNVAPIGQALRFMEKVLHAGNELERKAVDGFAPMAPASI